MLEGKSRAESVFSEAWQQVVAGRSIETVLADYPECADELEPMLRLTMRVRGLSALQPSPDALARIGQRTGFACADALSEKEIKGNLEREKVGGHPQTPGRGAPLHPFGAAEEIREYPQTPGRETPAPLRQERGVWGQPQTPARAIPALPRKPWFASLFSTVQISTGALLLLLIGVMLTSAALVLLVAKVSSPAGTSSPVVAYSGTIIHIEGGVWQVDDAQVFIDDSTQINGQPVVGATMHCIAQPVGDNKLKAIEVWVGSAPATPTAGPGIPSGTGSI